MLNGLSDPLQMFHSDRGGRGVGHGDPLKNMPTIGTALFWKVLKNAQ